ncbi:hypothetical protein cyc_04292 [Cyclospora cayetanensis]|uniref:Uncharacterized protein n=1 Tax=Cyclospora cayetanensis TaxID=88456 RepID=A0A1D3CT08_9EIME|nr:hypothetical protein cyc_04292 [Cyclospora cayetanensis]
MPPQNEAPPSPKGAQQPPSPATGESTAVAASAARSGESQRSHHPSTPNVDAEAVHRSPSGVEETREPFLHADNARIMPQVLGPSAFADNVEMEVVERLSKSQVRVRKREKIATGREREGEREREREGEREKRERERERRERGDRERR